MHRNGKGRVLKKMVLKEWWSLVCIFSMLEEDVTQEWEGKISEKVVLKRSTTSHHAGPQGFHDRHHGYSCGISHCYHCAPLYRQWLQSPLSLCTTVLTTYTCGYSHHYHCAPPCRQCTPVVTVTVIIVHHSLRGPWDCAQHGARR